MNGRLLLLSVVTSQFQGRELVSPRTLKDLEVVLMVSLGKLDPLYDRSGASTEASSIGLADPTTGLPSLKS